ncbi:hypothetical protein F0562_011401 [Nyssa sinensis]|uniref:DUF1685 domain-containing protein n=1 Tax=Nyssa sinensis TaxID=561372 RepID=A0A5J5A6A4_9ASTE|nr:hypothetical protein F0562_011401 [Nyssa sinensis]
MAMDEEQVLKLFDSYWFEYEIFTNKSLSSSPEPNPVLQIHEEVEEAKLFRIQTFHVRSFSDQIVSSKDSFSSDSVSPNSALLTPNLQTILSGKEVGEFFEPVVIKQEDFDKPSQKRVSERRRIGRRKGSSKSLSDLEFEELKGFMDLGFVFSEEDKNSSLVSIIPGLQRLGRKVGNDGGAGGEDDDEEEKEEKAIYEYEISRPYLSEAWDVLDQRKVENPLMKWRIPALGNEMDMKDHLRFWAHAVAST